MKPLKYTSVLILLIFSTFLFGITDAQVLNTERISLTQGLSDNHVFSIFQDSYGFIWVGTLNGLDMYDGYNFTIYRNELNNDKSIANNEIFKITEDKGHNIWTAGRSGVSEFNRYNHTFKNFDLRKFLGSVPRTNPEAVDIYCDRDNNIWVGSVGGGLLKYNRKSMRFEQIAYDTANAGKPTSNGDVIKGICFYNGKLWVMSWQYGLCYYDSVKGLLEINNFIYENNPSHLTNFTERGTYLYPDQNGNLWISTIQGIYKYSRKNNIMDVIKRNNNIPMNQTSAFPGIAQDADGNIWIGSGIFGLLKFEGVTDNYKRIYLNKSEENSKNNTPDFFETSLCLDNSGIMWIGTLLHGIYKYDRNSEPFVSYQYDMNNKNSLSGNYILALSQSTVNKDLIYVGIRGAGFDKFYPLQHKFERIPLKLKKDTYGGSVRSFLENGDGTLYLGTLGAGLYKYYPDGTIKLVLQSTPLSTESLSDNNINVLRRDGKGRIWIGTSNGLNIYDPVTKKITGIYSVDNRLYPDRLMNMIRSKENSRAVLQSILKVGDSQNITKLLTIEKPGNYLMVSAGEGTNAQSAYNFDYGWLENKKGDTVWSARNFYKSFYLGGASKNRIVAGMVKLVPGIYKLRYRSDDSHSYGHWNAAPPPDSELWGIQVIKLTGNEQNIAASLIQKSNSRILISGTNIGDINFSPDGTVWIGTIGNGLTRYNPATGKINYFTAHSKDPDSLSNNRISMICRANNGILWITTQNGLDRFDPATKKFKTYYEENGLPSNNLTAVLEDDDGNLWISSDNGITRMNTDISDGRVSFVNYDTRYGLASTTFNALVAAKGSDGKLYFGSDQGLVEFSPVKFNSKPPVVQLTNVRISNESVTSMGNEDPLKTTVMDAKEMKLSSFQNDISFDFTALNFSHPEKNKYAHILKGYDKNWIYDNRRFANYTNLDPGKYVFEIRAANSDGIWNNKGKSLTIIIMPPWWKTGWAYAGYIFIFAGLVFSADRIQRRRLLSKEREKQRINEMELRAQTAELHTKALEAESRALELENERKTKELEEARQLQLSLLPKKLPKLPNLDIAVYMKTATEVGGDYYDFHVGMDGTLTVVLGDATGHGMKAGTMVTAAKSLFNSYAANPDILVTFHEMSRCIKQMHFHMLSMCFAMLKISSSRLKMSSAGMPPIIIYRKDDRTVEEHVIKGMPLGTIDKFPYDVRETKLNKGDTLLMLSDGLPELHNDEKDMYGYKRVRNEFENVAEKSPEEIIEHLKNSGSDWVNGREPDDDVTFVVIKMK